MLNVKPEQNEASTPGRPQLKALTFRHGVHPEEMKAGTQAEPMERMPFVDEYIVPLSQHIGAPSLPMVKAGEKVKRGQMIAAAKGFISTAQHAPVTGEIVAVEARPHPSGRMMQAIVVRTDPWSSQRIHAEPPKQDFGKQDLVRLVQEAGIVGLGGAAFPSHVKLSVPEGKKAVFAMLNGCECEPFLTCDHRLMLERPERVLRGLELIMKQTDTTEGYIGIEVNKLDAIQILRDTCIASGGQVRVVPLQVKYPQGAEKLLIDAIFKKEVPAGGLPLDVEVVSYNVGSAAAIADLVDHGHPLVERVVTVTGPGVRRKKNLIVPIGTPVREVLAHCDLDSGRLKQLIMGGPMMGMAQKRLDVPIIKGSSGLLAMDEVMVGAREELPCIRCGRCLEACPMFLNPSRLAAMVRAGWVEELGDYHLMNCFECGSCSFVCPSFIPLAHLMRLGKAMIKQKKVAP